MSEAIPPKQLEVSQETLKLTTYFGERSRLRGRLLADELLDIHAHHQILSSVLLRGIQGFGAKHRRRTDRLLTLSEDLPLVSIVLDTREHINALLGEVGSIGHEGLITLERAHLHSTEIEPAHPRPARPSPPSDEAVKLTVHLGRHEHIEGIPAFRAVCQTLHEAGVAGATVLLGVDGVRHGERRRARFFAGNANVPMMVMAVGDPSQIDKTLTHLEQALPDPLFTIERIQLCKRDGQLIQAPHNKAVPSEYSMDLRQKLTIVISEAAHQKNKPVHLELVRRMRTAQAAGATSVRGIWGFHGDHTPHGDRLLSIRRHVPIVTDIIDTPERITTLFEIVDELTSERGLVTSEMVPATSTLHAGHNDLVGKPPDRAAD